MNERGRFFKTIVKPSTTGNLRVVASVPGADTAISTRHAAEPLARQAAPPIAPLAALAPGARLRVSGM